MKKEISILEAQCSIEEIHKIRAASLEKQNVYENTIGRPGDCFIYIISGTARYTTDFNETFYLQPGNVLFLRKGITYHVEALSEGYTYIFVEFTFHTDELLLQNELFSNPKEDLEPQFRALLEADVLKQPGYRINCIAILYRIYLYLIQHNQNGSAISFKHPQIERASYEIGKNFQNPDFRIYDVAAKTGMSEVYFRKLFKEECGMSPSKYLTALRIAHAKNLMTYKHLSISEIAAFSGFSDIYYFSRQFKNITGLTPTEYKRYILAY